MTNKEVLEEIIVGIENQFWFSSHHNPQSDFDPIKNIKLTTNKEVLEEIIVGIRMDWPIKNIKLCHHCAYSFSMRPIN